MSGYIFEATEADFDDLVRERSHQTPVLVDISADWCAPCRVLAPMLNKLAAAYQGQFLLALVDADENMRIAGKHQVRGFPTVVAYSRGVEVDRFYSAKPESFLRDFIDRLIAQHQKVATSC